MVGPEQNETTIALVRSGDTGSSHGLALILALAAAPIVAEEPLPIGRQIESFQLDDYLGAKHSLVQLSEKKAVVVAFLGVECPLAKLYGPRLAELAAEYEKQGVAFLGIDSNRQDSLAELAHYARTHKIEFPLLKDPGNAVADQFGARARPRCSCSTASGRSATGAGSTINTASATRSPRRIRKDLAVALDELLTGEAISEPVQSPVGCFIGKVKRTPPVGEVTYTRDIAALVQQHCAVCHREGQVAPFELTSYEDVSAWADTIGEVIEAGRMPPWHADPKHGKFFNDPTLPDAAKQKIADWIAGGCPQGDAEDLPPPREFPEGWQIPQPDVVFKMPEPYAVPAKGTVEYQHFTIDPGWTEDKWIKASECRPGNRAVTHHLILFFHPPGTKKFAPEEPLFNSIAAFAPGLPPSIYPEGVYRLVPAGSKLIIQAHYTPNGTAQTDQSDVGLVFADPETTCAARDEGLGHPELPVPSRFYCLLLVQRIAGAHPFHGAHPASGAADSNAVSSYGVPGSGGRQPMVYAGPMPLRRPDDEIVGRRPVVATLDTGCGKHPWLVGVVTPGPTLDGQPIGYVDDETDPEKWFDQVGALDGSIDPLAGHGTFIAGLVHQACPDADVIAWRIVGSDGPMVESDLVTALKRIARLARRHRDNREGGHPIDVLNLSMGYYHETPEDLQFDPTMYDILRVLGECGVSVVCSAGNDATARPMFPAAFAPWADGKGGKKTTDKVVPVMSVGALNPNGTDALFSNAGPWVRAYAPGAAVMSTLPPSFQGGQEPEARSEAYTRRRESIDPDDFSGSFALWSGTSFSAPLFAGAVAAELLHTIEPGDDGRAPAVKRGWKALTALTKIKP